MGTGPNAGMSEPNPGEWAFVLADGLHVRHRRRPSCAGTLIAIDEINDRGGITAARSSRFCYDPGSDIRSYGQYTKRLMVEDGCEHHLRLLHLLQPQGGAAGGRAARRTSLVPDPLRGFRVLAERHLHGRDAQPEQRAALSHALMQQFGNRFFFVGSDYFYPRESTA